MVSVAEAAVALDVQPRQVRNLIVKGYLRAEKVGRDYVIERTALDAVPKDRKPGPKPGRPARRKGKKA